ncbi:glucose-1-phosphate adenylyltransferase [Congzhengia sp.]|jgi:glucose-1-phosphate adenylyltransferase|uniref:glucose-1-phosphate adenylyltransferase n=1 Tax=Congzhengia sp. TaxID=2944168 RepID=UPI000E7EC8E4|nr:glucose-1-phosphate adenylyltransferase [Clostridiales bacterium]HBL82103.1 glucose-1-phosphate adenylyltransferase [Clostridiales bacterium]
MAIKKEMIAMLLAGGQGSRLFVLTNNRAKPAVPFGGKYRIIDFTLSNCSNSGIDTVGVLTQYKPMELNAYIGTGQPWDLDRMNGGIQVLPPYVTGDDGQWYKGTANAIYQNMQFIEQYSPSYVLVLSGDHVYKMDYAKMLAFHKERQADATIAVMDVPIDEASAYGIMNTKDDLSIYEFEEKPKQPKSTKASMGVYIFTWEKLKKYLIEDEQSEGSANDFGKNIIPAMLRCGERMFAYPFDGYWKDVGTINNLWEANMDLLNPTISLNLSDPLWRIYCRHSMTTPQYVGSHAVLKNSMITEGCEVDAIVNNSILFSDVTAEEDAQVCYSVVMRNAKIGRGAKVRYAIVADNAVIEDGAVVGAPPEDYPDRDNWGIAVVGQGAVVRSGEVVLPKQMLMPGQGK